MNTKKLVPTDPRVTSATSLIRGKFYHYIRACPKDKPVATVFLIHGFPDLGFGWRYQIPYFVSLGYQVVAPDMLGFGATVAPHELSQYSLKNIAHDIKDLATKIVGLGKIILGGHGIGTTVVWRTALWYPNLVQGIFSVCAPFIPPSKLLFASGDHMASFGYQLQFRGIAIENNIQGPEKVRQFLNALFKGIGPQGEIGFSTANGLVLKNLSKLNQSRLVSSQELDYYTQKYLYNGRPELKGPLKWYQTHSHNYFDELQLLQNPSKFTMPAFILSATQDEAFSPNMLAEMREHFEDLTYREVTASYWALWESPAKVNQQIAEWMKKVLEGEALAAPPAVQITSRDSCTPPHPPPFSAPSVRD